MDYYFSLFNAVTDAIEALERIRTELILAQQNAEEKYIEAEE